MNLEQTKNIDRLVNEKLGDEQNVEQLATLDNINRVQARDGERVRPIRLAGALALYDVNQIMLVIAETVIDCETGQDVPP